MIAHETSIDISGVMLHDHVCPSKYLSLQSYNLYDGPFKFLIAGYIVAGEFLALV